MLHVKSVACLRFFERVAGCGVSGLLSADPALGEGRATARRMLAGSRLPSPAEQIDRRLRVKMFSHDSRLLLEHVWGLMGCPCRKYFVVMRELWLPLINLARERTEALAALDLASLEPIRRRRTERTASFTLTFG